MANERPVLLAVPPKTGGMVLLVAILPMPFSNCQSTDPRCDMMDYHTVHARISILIKGESS